MAITHSLAPNPKWYIADLLGRPLAGGYLATFSSLNHTLLNPVFQDPMGLFPWTYVTIPNVGILGILFDENGSQGPFYFEFNSALPNELYYLEVYDVNGILQWTIDNFPPGAGGGGSIITSAVDLKNLITNNVMWRNIGQTPIAPGTFMKIAPGAHAALAQTSSNAGPDICFIKNNNTATDTIAFPRFPLGTTPFNGDVTPVDYFEYVCTGAGSAETKKLVQFPITHGVQNLSNCNVSITIWARATAGSSPTLTLQWFQFFGDGPSASIVAPVPIQTFSLTSLWQQFTVTSTVPSVSGKELGECGNDALFLQVQFPLGVTCSVDFNKPCAYFGDLFPVEEYQTYDMIDGIINAPRVGYVFASYDLVAPFGYIAMNDGTIGSATSGATTAAGIYTFNLYNWLYTNVTIPSNNTLCVVTGYTGNSINDFVANFPMNLPAVLGRTMASAGTGAGLMTTRVLGQIVGEESHILTIAEMPSHQHNNAVSPAVGSLAGPVGAHIVGSSTSAGTITFDNLAPQGGGGAHNIMQPTSFMNFFIKL